MKTTVLIALSIVIIYNLSMGQTFTSTGTNLKVEIDNFSASPPGCGVFQHTSIYEALVIDSLSVLIGKKILISIECKADHYSKLGGKCFTIKISDARILPEALCNFTSYSDEELKTKKKYNVLFLGPFPCNR